MFLIYSSCYVEISFRLEDDNEKIFKRTLFANTKRNKYEFNGSVSLFCL